MASQRLIQEVCPGITLLIRKIPIELVRIVLSYLKLHIRKRLVEYAIKLTIPIPRWNVLLPHLGPGMLVRFTKGWYILKHVDPLVLWYNTQVGVACVARIVPDDPRTPPVKQGLFSQLRHLLKYQKAALFKAIQEGDLFLIDRRTKIVADTTHKMEQLFQEKHK